MSLQVCTYMNKYMSFNEDDLSDVKKCMREKKCHNKIVKKLKAEGKTKFCFILKVFATHKRKIFF